MIDPFVGVALFQSEFRFQGPSPAKSLSDAREESRRECGFQRNESAVTSARGWPYFTAGLANFALSTAALGLISLRT